MDQFLGEIRMFGGNFAPTGWYFCNGSMLPISEHDALFALIGTTYGGDGITTFALPDLRGRIPVHASTSGAYMMGQAGGNETRILTSANLPSHSHQMQVSGAAATSTQPGSSVVPAATTGITLYNNENVNPVNMSSGSISTVGSSQPIPLMMPYLAFSFIIAYVGIFPSPN